MSDRKGYYLKRPGKATAPAAIVSVVVSPDADREVVPGGGCAVIRFHTAYVSAARKNGKKWCRRERFQFTTPDQFWQWLERWARPGRKTFLFAPTASDALTLLGFWDRIDQRGAWWERGKFGTKKPSGHERQRQGYSFARMVLKGSPDIIEYTIDGRTFCWLSNRNYTVDRPGNFCRQSGCSPPPPKPRPVTSGGCHLDRWGAESDEWLTAWAGFPTGGCRSTPGDGDTRPRRWRKASCGRG